MALNATMATEHVAHASTGDETGLFDGFFNAWAERRMARARRITRSVLARQTDAELASYGYTPEQIRALRAESHDGVIDWI